MNNDNGANQNVEQILASIRTSIADEPGPARLVAGERTSLMRPEPATAEEAAEFELPAMFKPGHPGVSDKPKLFGRLSDALKTPNEAARGRTVIPFDPVAAGRMLEPPTPLTPVASGVEGVSQSAHEDASVARTMPSFFDTRINRMGELTREAFAPKPAPAPPPEQPALPPALPAKAMTVHAADAPDDAAAQLLRPMLRAWLHDNMPKIVERALLSEIAQQGGDSPHD